MRGQTAIFGPLALQEWPMKTISVIQTKKLKDKLPTCKSAKITEFLARQRLFQKFGPLSLIDLDVGPLEKKVGPPCSRGFLVGLLHFFLNLDIRKDTRASKVD